MLAAICDDTWNVLNMQHITPNSKRWHYSDSPSGGHKKIKGPTHMVEGGHTLEKPATPTHESRFFFFIYSLSHGITAKLF